MTKNAYLRELYILYMSEKHTEEKNIIEDIAGKEYEHGFVTDLEQEFIPGSLTL